MYPTNDNSNEDTQLNPISMTEAFTVFDVITMEGIKSGVNQC